MTRALTGRVLVATAAIAACAGETSSPAPATTPSVAANPPPAAPPPVLQATTSAVAKDYPIILEPSVVATMRDGTKLYADIYHPKVEGRFPVLLTRTPYDKRSGGRAVAARAATHGYVAIVQDVRGRHESEGEFYPWKHESEDGYDTVEWAAALPYSNGKVGVYGSSYVGATTLLAAIARPLTSPRCSRR